MKEKEDKQLKSPSIYRLFKSFNPVIIIQDNAKFVDVEDCG